MVSKALFNEIQTNLKYHPNDGTFTWLKNQGGAKIGNSAGWLDHLGYRRIVVNKKVYMAHHLVWLCETGKLPNGILDHIDRNPKNNRFSNLRKVTQQQNSANRKLTKNNTSGYLGVSRHTTGWQAKIGVSGVRVYLGWYKSKDMAAKVYKDTAREWYGVFYGGA